MDIPQYPLDLLESLRLRLISALTPRPVQYEGHPVLYELPESAYCERTAYLALWKWRQTGMYLWPMLERAEAFLLGDRTHLSATPVSRVPNFPAVGICLENPARFVVVTWQLEREDLRLDETKDFWLTTACELNFLWMDSKRIAAIGLPLEADTTIASLDARIRILEAGPPVSDGERSEYEADFRLAFAAMFADLPRTS